MRWTREAIAARVDALAQRHAGAELVDAVVRFGRELEDAERDVLGRILLDRARREGAFEHALTDRIEARGWFRRRWEALERSLPVESAPPDVRALVAALGAADVRYVLTGSVAAAAYGADVEPYDLDIAPDLAPENLRRLARLLRRWRAGPLPSGPEWPEGLTAAEARAWRPEPATAAHLDHVFSTPHGRLDVVPERSLRYDALAARALHVDAGGVHVLVAHPADLIATLRPTKRKHTTRLRALEVASERVERRELAPRAWWAQ